MAEDVLQMMEELDLNDAVYYGFSDGGIIGLLLAMKTNRISDLIISGANLSSRGVRGWMRLMIQGMYIFTRKDMLRMMIEEPDIDPVSLREISARTLVIAGEKDVILESETLRIGANIPHAKTMILKGEGHGSYIVHSAKIAELILSFLN
jgi:pimeloyl-ACP methyl ester carboxylesterase